VNKIDYQDVSESVVSAPGLAAQEMSKDAEFGAKVELSPNQVTTGAEKNGLGHKPLHPSEFRSVLEQLDELGLIWTSDLPPRLIAKEPQINGDSTSKRLAEIQTDYPEFPNELGYVIWYALTGAEPSVDEVGTKEELDNKTAVVRERLITPEFREEFFFRHMLKVPYFDSLDWEVVVKTSERGVQAPPGTAYALVSLLLESHPYGGKTAQQITFAINHQRLEKLFRLFGDLSIALQKAHRIGDSLHRIPEEAPDVS